MICKCQRLRKFVKESFCPCVCVRLKNAPDFSVRVVLCGRKSCLDLCRMVCVIIDDRDTVECSFVFKAAVSTGKGQESLFDLLKVDAEQCSGNDCGKCIGYIVFSVDREENTIFRDRSGRTKHSPCYRIEYFVQCNLHRDECHM